MHPTSKHPITIEPNPNHIVVRCGGQVIASSKNALTLREANYDPVVYVPRRDVDLSMLKKSNLATHCPYKGDAEYYSITVGDKIVEDAAWSYREPCKTLFAIAGHLAFHPERIEALEEWE
jgi:uncharacterized protein (DUF427 family)